MPGAPALYDRRAKLDDLVAMLEKSRIKIAIPTPALTEIPIRAGKAREEIHNALIGKSAFEIAPFDVQGRDGMFAAA